MEQKKSPGEKPIEASVDENSARIRLLEAATKLFAEHGLEGTSTRDIAKAADLNISLISYYFGGKEGLYKTVILEFAKLSSARVEELLQKIDLQNLSRESFQAGMYQFVKGMIPIKLSSKDIHLILQREMMAGLPHARDVYEEIFSKILTTVVGVFEVAQKKGFLRKDINPYVLFLSMVHATDVYMQINQCPMKMADQILKLPEDMDQYVDQIFRIFIEGAML
ncbi:MAG: TetR/AcrR family transcriptional regulator [Pseudobdellovibrionaceae bacterium]